MHGVSVPSLYMGMNTKIMLIISLHIFKYFLQFYYILSVHALHWKKRALVSLTYLWHFNMKTILLTYLGSPTHSVSRYYGSLRMMDNLIDNLDCNGTESKLIDCFYNLNYQSSYRQYSPRVTCQYGMHIIANMN